MWIMIILTMSCGILRYGFNAIRTIASSFRRVKESCQIMRMQLGDALLLKSTLFESLHSLNSKQLQDPIGTVHEQGIFKLTPEEVELVLSRRNDLLRNY